MHRTLTWTDTFKLVGGLACAMPFILMIGYLRDLQHAAAEDADRTGTLLSGSNWPSLEPYMLGLLIFLIVLYGLRLGLPALLYRVLPERRGQGMLVMAVKCSIIFEILLVALAFSPAQETSSGPFSNNGWFPLAAGILLFLSICAQIIGMIIGGIVQFKQAKS